MTMPFRQWFSFSKAILYGGPSPANNFTPAAQWSATHIDGNQIGWGRDGGGDFYRWDILWRPNSGFEAITSLDAPASCCVNLAAGTPSQNDPSITAVETVAWISDESNAWDKNLVSGRFYDGVNNWDNYPQNVVARGTGETITIADLPESYEIWIPAYYAGSASRVLPTNEADFYKHGALIRHTNYLPGAPPTWGNNEYFTLDYIAQTFMVKFFNPVVNNLSRFSMPSAGGVALVLTGLGFENSDADIEEGGDAYPAGWDDLTDFIYFEGLQGQGTTTISEGAGDFTVDSNTQITIATMPALALGSYRIRLKKDAHGSGSNPEAYAGDFFADDDGRVFESSRFTFVVSDEEADEDDSPILLTTWAFKKGDTTIFRNYSPIDIITPGAFFDGRILSVGGIRRSLDDQNGLFQFSECSIRMANQDKEFSKLLAEYICKNQVVEIFSVQKNASEGQKTYRHRMVVENHSRPGAEFEATLRDVAAKYFQIRVPLYKATEEDYPDIDDSAKGRAIPEILGFASHTTGENPGAVEALYVDTVNHEYLAARGSLKEITQVYGDGQLIDPAKYSIVYKDEGRTYILFTQDQKEKRITFNAKGYMYGPWNSANGYVQSHAYILAFLLAFLAEIPLDFIWLDSFIDVHNIMVARGYGESGYFAIQDEQEIPEAMSGILKTSGIKTYLDKRGRFSTGIKDISNYATSLYIREQIDLLQPANRDDNLNQAFNTLNCKFEFYPAYGAFLGEDKAIRQAAVDAYEATIEPDDPADYKWTADAALAAARLSEELYRYGYGNYKLSISLSLDYFNALEVFTNFRYQDPWGLSLTGAGEAGRYYYVESIEYNFLENRMDIEAIDLQWLLRQYLILGDEDELAAAWADAGESDRMFAYLCSETTGKFSDGEDGKILVDENILGGS